MTPGAQARVEEVLHRALAARARAQSVLARSQRLRELHRARAQQRFRRELIDVLRGRKR